MAKFRVPYHCPHKFDVQRFAMNGQVPSPSALRRLADGFNHVLTVQKRQFFAHSVDWANAPDPSSGIGTPLWPIAFRTSRGTTGIVVAFGLISKFTGGSSRLTLDITPLTGGASVSFKEVHHGAIAAGTVVVPNEVNHQLVGLGGLTPNTEYQLSIISFAGAKPVYVAAWERMSAGIITSVEGMQSSYTVDDNDVDVCNPGQFESEGDILDTGIAKLITASNAMLKQSRRHLLAYTGTPFERDAASGLTISGSTAYSDVVTRTFHIDTTNLSTLRRSGSTAVPCRLAVRSDRTAGTGTLDLAIYDIDAAAIVAEVTGIADPSPAWAVASVTLPAQDGRYEIHARQSDLVTTHELYGVSMWLAEA